MGTHDRSGRRVVQLCRLHGYVPDSVLQVGVGVRHPEAAIMLQDFKCRLVGFDPSSSVSPLVYPGEFHAIAVGSFDGVVDFYQKTRHADGSGLWGEDHWKTREVSQTRIDSWHRVWAQANQTSGGRWLLWLDCEGSELNALNGAGSFLDLVDVVNVELNAKPKFEGQPSHGEIHDFLNADGFVRAHIHTNRSFAGQYDAVYIRENVVDWDFVNCPCQLKRFGQCQAE